MAMDGINRLRTRGSTAPLTLRDFADDIADYVAMRPETATTLDAFANFLAGLRTTTATAPPAHGRAHVVRTLLPGEADDMASGGSADRWVTVYGQLLEAADATDLGMDVHVHLLSRLMFWQTRASDHELAGRRATAVGSQP